MIHSNVLKAAVIVLALFFPVSSALAKAQNYNDFAHDAKLVMPAPNHYRYPAEKDKLQDKTHVSWHDSYPRKKPDKPAENKIVTNANQDGGKSTNRKDSKNTNRSSKTPQPQRPKPARPKYHVISRFHLMGNKPYAVLKKIDGSEVRLSFSRREDILEISDAFNKIPKGTRLTVPENCMAYCVEGDTKMISGFGQRADFEGSTRIQYKAGSEVEYTAASGLVIVPANYESETVNAAQMEIIDITPEIPATPEPPIVNIDRRSSKPDWINPDEVIPSYGLPQELTYRLLDKHREAIIMKSKDERADKYKEIFNEFSYDYLAAYYAAAAEFEMAHGYGACEWCDKALAVNPKYLPAKQLRKKAEGLL